jgi:hypothetical protein
MGLLLLPDGQPFTLRARTLVGRGPHCDLRLGRRESSTDHAAFRWTGQSWELHDLASRNGTRVNGERLGAHWRLLSVGDRLQFGSVEDAFQVAALGPPSTWAVALDGGPSRSTTTEMLALPSEDEPLMMITVDELGNWMLEQGETSRPVTDREVLTVAGRTFQLCLPGPTDGTWEEDPNLIDIEQIALRFRVSLDEEHVEVDLLHRGRAISLGARGFHYPLLLLARARLQDQGQANLPASAHGWILSDTLQRMLRVDANRLSVDLFRARKQLADLGVEGAQHLIERRVEARQLRLAVANLQILPLT